MNSNITNQTEDQFQESLSVVELEERHEMTAAGADLGRCNGNEGKVEKAEPTESNE